MCAQLAHPGVVPIHELSSFEDGRPFVTMKLVEGKTLLQLLSDDPPIKLDSALKIFDGVCETMAYAHQRGIVHRDLKPSNIMVGSFGEVQIMDWGIAKDLSGKHDSISNMVSIESPTTTSPAEDNASEDTAKDLLLCERTMIGTVFGTLAYMSPEQASGNVDAIDVRADVFALGAVLCRILTGKPLYTEEKLEKLLEMAQNGDTLDAINRLHQSPHRKLAKLAVGCLAFDPNKRPSSAGELARALTTVRRKQQRMRQLTTLSLVAIAVLLIAGTFLIHCVVRSSPAQLAWQLRRLLRPQPLQRLPAQILEMKLGGYSAETKRWLYSVRKKVKL